MGSTLEKVLGKTKCACFGEDTYISILSTHILDNFISFVLQINQDTTTTNYPKIIAFSKKKVLGKDFKTQKKYELLLQKSKRFQRYDCQKTQEISKMGRS